jgi:hypothetical protein
LQNFSEHVGGLYDKIPASVPSNITCTDDPGEKVLGYFSVSARSSRRIFIKDNFAGLINLYTNCIDDTVFNGDSIPTLNITSWLIGAGFLHPTIWEVDPISGLVHQVFLPPVPYELITYKKSCADCTERGTKTEPDFWNEDK